jgi:hypothetical protein
MTRTVPAALVVVALLTVFRARLTQVEWTPTGWEAESPRSARPVIPTLESDLDSDGRVERIVLADGRISILSGGLLRWTSPPDWEVTAAEAADLNWDGRPEAVLLVWRMFHPWPVDAWLPYGGRVADFHDAENRSCHIILFGWDGSTYRELWAGSALAEPILAFHAADWDGDGRQELAAIESTYAEPGRGRAVALWRWNGFGFTLAGRKPADIVKFAFLRKENGMPSVLMDHSDGVPFFWR